MGVPPIPARKRAFRPESAGFGRKTGNILPTTRSSLPVNDSCTARPKEESSRKRPGRPVTRTVISSGHRR